jgi:hypothetical protein
MIWSIDRVLRAALEILIRKDTHEAEGTILLVASDMFRVRR